MSKMIAVCGAPNSGKTATSLKIAQEMYNLKKLRFYSFLPI